mmetsp:Transcript_40420/g.129791  ORF Transcript_40420/g.129791 Transcript_40420/m.129791 type:complete len:276 (-) Transcript_40420:1912-2739(-)
MSGGGVAQVQPGDACTGGHRTTGSRSRDRSAVRQHDDAHRQQGTEGKVVCVGSSEDSAEQAEILGTRDKGASLVLDTREKDKGKGHKVKSKHDKKKGKKKKARKKEKRKAKKAKKRLKKHKNKRKCIQLSSSTSSSSSDSSSSEACPRDVALDFETFLERGDVLLAQHLIRRRGSEWRSASGDGPLHMATRKNRPELVAWLLESGGAGAGAGACPCWGNMSPDHIVSRRSRSMSSTGDAARKLGGAPGAAATGKCRGGASGAPAEAEASAAKPAN